MSKVKLILEKKRPWEYLERNNHLTRHAITWALPFFRSRFGSVIHRVRSGQHHYLSGQYTHSSVKYWCGNNGFFGSKNERQTKGEFFADAPDNSIFCATCEGRAIGAGMDGTREINGRRVLFRPKA